ncbi:MAG: 23S rRNA (uracil(1939)-C(5))-methyltransferase RlmD [Chitinophagaceae bacterium]|nr:MAG: 23S rRNA (uracil(1939)-C(5))-methyltransferase RlmD [Chitinophagaceae bacterium]
MAAKRKKDFRVLEKIPVTNYAAEGKSLGKTDGKIVFIEGGAVPGDIVDVRLYKNKKDWAEGKAVFFHAYSKDRVQPFCAHFGTCGGCQWQMLPYEKQLFYKQQQVTDVLHHIGKLALPDTSPIIGADETKFYRNKLEFTFSNRSYLSEEEIKDKGFYQKDALGFHLPRLFDKILDIHTCYLQAEPSNKIRNTVRAFALQKGYSFYDHRAQTGWLRNLIIRTTTTGEVMVILCLHHEDEEERKALLNHLLQQVPEITTLLYIINPKKNDSIADLHPEVYYGKGYILEKLGQYTFKIGPKSFFQTNTRQAEKLYNVVRTFAGLRGSETVYDLYCGAGSIGIFISENAKKVIGVEQIAEAVKHAKENALLNHINGMEFFEGDVIDICTDVFFAQHGKADVVITDPPRAGMHERLISRLLEMEAPRIIYVSCNPATQARDLIKLCEKYTVEKIQPVDLFPHTQHIENVVLLKKIKNNAETQGISSQKQTGDK